MTKIKSSLKNKSMPKYQRIGEKLIGQILAGKHEIDSLLPTEKQLCTAYKISRHTAREALRYVEKTGLVERRQGSGTQVKRTSMPEQINEFINSINDLLLFGKRTRFDIRISDMIQLDAVLAELLDVKQALIAFMWVASESNLTTKNPSAIQIFIVHSIWTL